MFTVDTRWAKADDCVMVKHGSGKNVRYDIVSISDGPMGTLNLVGYGKDETTIAMKNSEECEGFVDWAIKSHLIKKVISTRMSGFIIVYLVELNTKTLNKMLKGA